MLNKRRSDQFSLLLKALQGLGVPSELNSPGLLRNPQDVPASAPAFPAWRRFPPDVHVAPPLDLCLQPCCLWNLPSPPLGNRTPVSVPVLRTLLQAPSLLCA